MAERTVPPAPKSVPEAILRRAGILPPYTVIACGTVFFWTLSLRALIYTLMPTIAADLRLSASMAGLVISANLLGYCAGQLATGWLPGTSKQRILGGVLLSLPAAVLVSTAGSFWALLIAAAVAGIGHGTYLPLGLGLVVGVAGRDSRARYLAVHEVFATMATFSGSAFVAVALAWTDWRGSVMVWCAVGVLALLVFSAVRDGRGDTRARRDTRPLPMDRTLLYSAYSHGAATLLLAGLVSVLPLIMVKSWGLEQTHAASVTGYSRLPGLIAVAIVWLTADRLGHRRVSTAFQLLSLVGTVAMALDGYSPLFLAGVLLVAAGSSGTISLVPAVIAPAYAAGQTQRVMGVVTSVGGLLGMVVCPALFGTLVDAGLPTGPMVVSAAVTFLAILATRGIHPRTPPR